MKGLGGYHLACDATDEQAVATLRKRKDRGDKPFAVMVADAATADLFAEVSDAQRALLQDQRRPCVLLAKRTEPGLALAAALAPDSPEVGVLLAYTPLHHLLFGLPGDPPGARVLVMTSGNLSGEPIVTDDAQARTRLAGLADAWLANDRPIHVPCDDSVVRVVAGAELPVRRSRGYAPLPVALPVRVRPALAVGGDLKNTFCLAEDGYAWMSAHVGDMDDLRHTDRVRGRHRAPRRPHRGASRTHRRRPAPRVPTARHGPGATRQGLPVRAVQHHHAHIASAMAENGLDGSEKVIGFAFDGTGFGDDHAAWGGETLLADYDGYERAAHLRYTWLPGGDAGVRNPCRMALSHLHEAGVGWDPALPSVQACGATERAVLARQVETGLGSIRTSSMGRLFDAVSSLAGVCHRTAYEAEAAMRFEGRARSAIEGLGTGYRFAIIDGGPLVADPRPVVAAAARDVLAGVGPDVVAARFHLAVVDLVADLAVLLRARTGLGTVAMSGGVFLNVLLTTLCADRLHRLGFRVVRHRTVPPSDAGLALGQVVIAARTIDE